MNYRTILTTTAVAAVYLLASPAWAQDKGEIGEEVAAKESPAKDEWKKFADMGAGVYKVKLADDGSMKSCIIVGQARISKALGKAKGLMDAKKAAKTNAEGEFISFLKTHVSNVRQNGDTTEIRITGVDDNGDPIEDAKSTETKSQITTSQAQGQLRGMQLIAFDQDAESETFTQIYAWKPAFAAVAAGVAGAMNTADAAPGKAAPTGIDGQKGVSGASGAAATGSSGKKKVDIKSKTQAVEGAEEFL